MPHKWLIIPIVVIMVGLTLAGGLWFVLSRSPVAQRPQTPAPISAGQPTVGKQLTDQSVIQSTKATY